MLRRAAILVLVMLRISAPAYAIDHKNLDAGRPTRLDDAYTIAAGEIAGVPARPAKGFFACQTQRSGSVEVATPVAA